MKTVEGHNNMQSQELIERYIYAVTRHIRKEEREDIAKELRSIIADMLEERMGEEYSGESSEMPDEETVKAVLESLGSPQELYEKYSSDGKDCLIGAPYYGVYKYIMKIVLGCVIFGMVIAHLVISITETVSFYEIMARLAGVILGGALFSFAFVTLIFAIFYHKGIKMDNIFDSLDNLPKLPEKNAKISRLSSGFGIAFSIIFWILFLACPQILCMFDGNTGEMIPIFSVEYIQKTWYLIVLFALLGIIRESVKLIDARYSKRLLVVTAVVDIVAALLCVGWLKNPAIINADFAASVSGLFAEGMINTLMLHFNYFFLGCILFALILDLAVTVSKTDYSK